MLQGLALGAGYGRAAVYVAEHAPQSQRGYDTCFIRTIATLGLLLSPLVILMVQGWADGNYPDQPVRVAAGVAVIGGDGVLVMQRAFDAWGLTLPYHTGDGWFGGLLPAPPCAISAHSGNIYAGLWYAIVIAIVTVVITTLFVLNNTHKKDIFTA